jgi:hypothetical protein
MFRHSVGEEITLTLSMAWNFTTKSSGIWRSQMPTVSEELQFNQQVCGGEAKHTLRMCETPRKYCRTSAVPTQSASIRTGVYELMSRAVHYTPKHAFWMNQIEMWFSILVRKLLKRASFTSVEELQAKVLAFIEYFNATMAKPFNWTYGRQPLSV